MSYESYHELAHVQSLSLQQRADQGLRLPPQNNLAKLCPSQLVSSTKSSGLLIQTKPTAAFARDAVRTQNNFTTTDRYN